MYKMWHFDGHRALQFQIVHFAKFALMLDGIILLLKKKEKKKERKKNNTEVQ